MLFRCILSIFHLIRFVLIKKNCAVIKNKFRFPLEISLSESCPGYLLNKHYFTPWEFLFISVSWWLSPGDWVRASLPKSPGLFSVFWTISSRSTNSLVTVPRAPITIGIIVTFMLYSFENSLERSRYLCFSHYFNSTLWSISTWTAKSTILQVLSFLLIIIRFSLLIEIKWSVCDPSKSHFPGQMQSCAYTVCSYGQISLSCIIPWGSTCPPSCSNLRRSLLRFCTRPNEWGTQWDSNSLV